MKEKDLDGGGLGENGVKEKKKGFNMDDGKEEGMKEEGVEDEGLIAESVEEKKGGFQ